MPAYDANQDRRVELGEPPFDPYESSRGDRVGEPHKGYYTRGYLPHIDRPGLQFITFRLHDSFPACLLDEWRAELALLDEDERRREAYRRTEAYVDTGHGECWLRRPEIARIVERQLTFHDGERYELRAWCIMPNHIHLVADLREGCSLPKIVQSWKARSARRANAALRRSGPFWYRDYYDRYIRDENHLANCLRYIDMNPVKAALCAVPEEWPWGSARLVRGLEGLSPSATRRSTQ